jgi:hypothetical protein
MYKEKSKKSLVVIPLAQPLLGFFFLKSFPGVDIVNLISGMFYKNQQYTSAPHHKIF